MKLHMNHGSMHSRRTLSLAQYLGSPVEVVNVDMGKGQHKSPEYLALNPNGKVPTLVDGNFVLWESNAIMHYLAEKAGSDVLPRDAAARADMERWMFWGVIHMSPPIGKLVWENFLKALLGVPGGPDEAAVKNAQKDAAHFAAILEQQLTGREWITGKLTLADFTLGSLFDEHIVARFDLGPYPAIGAWLQRVRGLKGWVSPPSG